MLKTSSDFILILLNAREIAKDLRLFFCIIQSVFKIYESIQCDCGGERCL